MKKFLVSLSLIALAVNAHADGGKEGSLFKDAKNFAEKIKDEGAKHPYPLKVPFHLITLTASEVIAIPAGVGIVAEEEAKMAWQATKATGQCMTDSHKAGKLGEFTGCVVTYGGNLVGIAISTVGFSGIELVNGVFRLTAEGLYVIENMLKDTTEYFNAHNMPFLAGTAHVLQVVWHYGAIVPVQVVGGTIVSVLTDGTVSLVGAVRNFGQAGAEALKGNGKAAAETLGVAVGFGGCAVVDTLTAPLRGIVALVNAVKPGDSQYPWTSCTYNAIVSQATGWRAVPLADPYEVLRSN